MTDAEYKKQKARVEKYLDKWFKPAGFGWFGVSIDFNRHLKDDREFTSAADTSTHWQYRKAHINFYLPAIVDIDDAELERVVVHELSHVLIGSVSNFSNDEYREMTEYATECVTQALLYTNKYVKK